MFSSTQILCFHWLSTFGNSKVMNFGILLNTPNLDTNLFSTSSAFKHTTISILTDSPCQRASRVVAGPLTDLVTRTGWPWKAGTACFDKALSMALWIASRACKSDYDVSYIHALWAVNNWQCPETFLVFLISEIWAIPILWKCMCSTKWCYLTYTMGSSKAHSCYSCIWNFLIE